MSSGLLQLRYILINKLASPKVTEVSGILRTINTLLYSEQYINCL
jgi:hypothetical protein